MVAQAQAVAVQQAQQQGSGLAAGLAALGYGGSPLGALGSPAQLQSSGIRQKATTTTIKIRRSLCKQPTLTHATDYYCTTYSYYFPKSSILQGFDVEFFNEESISALLLSFLFFSCFSSCKCFIVTKFTQRRFKRCSLKVASD